jgi:hypothetical protein
MVRRHPRPTHVRSQTISANRPLPEQKNGVAVDFRSPERLSDDGTRGQTGMFT